MHNKDLILGGEIVATGTDSVWIKLASEYPKVVSCHFTDEPSVPPTCNPPPIEDVLRYAVQMRNGHFHLLIKWSIYSGTRNIKWGATY